MKYRQQYTIQACHFNGSDEYAAYHDYLDLLAIPEGLGESNIKSASDALRAARLIEGCARNSHGHNFVIEIEAVGAVPPEVGFVIDEWALRDVVMEWNDTNLSMHPDFKTRRASTENMADIMAEKVLGIAGPNVRRVTVKVWERPEICAEISKSA